MFTMFFGITRPYHAVESWIYDAMAAPAVTELIERDPGLQGHFLNALPERARLLDVGSGGGQLAVSFAHRHPGWHVTGLDQSRAQVRRARARSRGLEGRVAFLIGSAVELPFGPCSFDGVISVCSIKHWPDRAKGLEECLRVLRPGAPLAVIEVDREFRFEDARAFVARQRVPAWLRFAAMAGFRRKVAARSLSMEEAMDLFKGLPASGVAASRPDGTPFWMITTRKGRGA